jgi:uncharacterized membrane protein YcjF (UPF0283 family)
MDAATWWCPCGKAGIPRGSAASEELIATLTKQARAIVRVRWLAVRHQDVNGRDVLPIWSREVLRALDGQM